MKKNEILLTNVILFVIIEAFLALVFFEWNQSINIRMNCIISSGIISIIGIILLALGIGNKNKQSLFYGIELIVLAIFTFSAFYILAVIPPLFTIGSISAYVFVPFGLFFVYYLIKILYISKKA